MSISQEVQRIRDKLLTVGWPKFIKNIQIDKIHSLDNKIISFKFPVCAIVGENGTGKSTILKIVASCYRNSGEDILYPSNFFPDTAWEKLKGIKIIYEIQLGEKTIQKKITKLTERWRGITERIENSVYFFHLGRVVPVESLIGYARIAKRNTRETSSRDISQESVTNISEIMGRNYASGRLAKTSADEKREIGILKYPSAEISKFHQGSGESITFDLISKIENIPDCSLIVIDEIESSLHPKAQRRLIRQLLHLARTKTLQIVFSTHSPYVLSELPPDARILLTRINGGVSVVYGPSVEFCLSQIDDVPHPELSILVEDEKAKTIVSDILRVYLPSSIQRVSIIPVGSANIIKMLEELYLQKKIPFRLLGIADADQSEISPVLKLPGIYAPEKQIIKDLCEKNLFNFLSPFLGQDINSIKREFEEVQTITNDRQWLSKLTERFNISPVILWGQLSFIWVKNCVGVQDVKKILETIDDRLSSD